MANRSERLRKAYEFKLGKDVASKLSDEQIQLISGYYSSLSEDEQRKIDSNIFMGKTNDLSEMASSFIEENDEPPVKKAKVTATATKEKPKGALVPVGKSGEDLVDEKIDERILRIIGLDDVFDIDYDTYISLLKEQSVLISTGKSKIPREEEILIQDEFKRVKKRKGAGRFKVNKITAESFKKGTAVGLNLQKLSAEVKSPPLMLSPAMESVEKINEIVEIKDALKEIIGYLTQQNKDAKKKADLDRKSSENKKRAEKESALEKGSGKVMKIAEKILAPVKSLLQRIIDFITAVFFGRALIKLIDWLANPENKTKIDSILRFLGDHWPALLALYLRFGTGLGKFVGAISNIVIKGGIRLAALALQLLAKAGVGKAAGAAKFLGGRGGRLLGAGLQLAATVGSTQALSSGIENFGGIGGEKQEPPKVEGRVGGGAIKIPKFAGGGFNFGGFGNLFSGIGNFFSGLVSGKKGVDKIPAMLSDGEFVMSAGAVRKHGVSTLEAMNAAGGGTNKPKMIAGATYAAGGGLIGSGPMTMNSDKPSSSPTAPKIPILSPINLSSSSSNVNVSTGNNAIDISANLIKKEEALSSVSPGKNDYIVPGGKSVVSGTDWSNIGPKTKIYAYPDSRGIPTIGWGATFYDGITSGTKSVKLGDSITKENADKILANNIGILAEKYSKEIANWSKMSPQQQSAILSIGYNAGPNAPLGAYPKLSAAIKSGNMVEVANNITRSGPSTERLANERKLLLSGPKDLTKETVVASKPTTSIAKNQPNIFQQLGSTIGSIFSPRPAMASEGSIESPSAKLQKSQLGNRYSISAPSKSKTRVVYVTASDTGTKPNISSGGGTPKVPAFSASHSSGHSRSAKMLGIK
jgi:GH24 family phage-related lysozyme (muramidase)